MEKITITARLDHLALRYDYTIVCKNIRNKVVEKKYDEEFGTTICKWGVELTNPVEYNKDELLKKYDGSMRISRWVDTYTEDGQPAMAVVIEK